MSEHRVLNGSLLDPTALPELMRGERADVLYSDPPWGPGLLATFGAMAGNPQRGRWPEFVTRFAREANAHVREDGHLFVEMGYAWAQEISVALETAGRKVSQRWETVYRSGSKWLPAVLLHCGAPVELDPLRLRGVALPLAALRSLGLREGGVVLDPCCGKGYTARACRTLGLSFRGMELNAARLEVTRRWLASR